MQSYRRLVVDMRAERQGSPFLIGETETQWRDRVVKMETIIIGERQGIQNKDNYQWRNRSDLS